MKIRLANNNDLESIIKIEEICFPPAEAATAQDIQERFSTFPENFIVAEDDGKIVGFINGCTTTAPILNDELYHDCSLHQPSGEYQTVFGLDVLPEYRHQGIAGALLRYMINLSYHRRKKGIVLTCKDHLIHYYEKFGFMHQGVSASQHGQAVWNDMLLVFENETIAFEHNEN